MKAPDINHTRPAAVPAGDGPPFHSSSGVPSPRDLSILAVVTASAAALRFHAVAVKSLWIDEGVSVGIARLDWDNFVRILWRREANMSLYYLLLRGWLHLGHSEAFIRSLSVFFGLAAIPALYLLGRRLFDSRIALTAAALLCVNSYHVHYSQEARSYSLTVFLCILSSLYFVKLLEVPSRGNRIAYILLSVLAVYAHFFAGLLLLAHWISLRFLDPFLVPNTRRIWASIAAAISPAIVFVATTGAGPLSWIQRPGLHDLWQLALYLTGDAGPLLLLLYAAAGVAAVAGNIEWGKRQVCGKTWRCRFLLLWMFVPVLLVLAVSVARPVFLARYFIFSMPALLLLAACGLARIPSRWLFTAILLIFLGISFRGTTDYYQRRSTSPNEDWRAASLYLLDHAHSGDALVFHAAMGRLPYEYYRTLPSPSPDGTVVLYPVVLYPNHGPRITFLDFVEKPNYSDLELAISQHPRVWFVISSSSAGLERTTAALSALISPSHPLMERRDFGGIQLVLYRKAGAP